MILPIEAVNDPSKHHFNADINNNHGNPYMGQSLYTIFFNGLYYTGCQLWNNLPLEIREFDINDFKKEIKAMVNNNQI